MKKKILILQTGGTISMFRADKEKITLKPVSGGKDLAAHVPELSRIAKVDTVILDNIDSSNVTPRHWEKWLKVLKSKYSLYDGFVVTHGTDTMTYSASAFSFALGKMTKSIVFTGSQRPLGMIRTDASVNLINSVETACRGPEMVSLCFGNQLLSAVRATKLSATEYTAFESFNYPHLATIGVDYEPHWRNLTPQPGNPVWKSLFNEKVFSFKIFPGISGEILKHTIKAPECLGVVLDAYGAGNVPSLDDSVIAMIKEATRLSKPVLIASQCPHGRVDLTKYESGIKALKAGAVSAGDMTGEASVVKLMHGLGMGLKKQDLKNYLTKNICGERSF